MSLIDAEALKKAVEQEYNETLDGIVKFGIEKAYNLIDNAPTVEYPFYQEAYQTGYEEGKNERPHGKWIYKCCYGDEYPQCSNCGEINDVITNFCPDCGADMRSDKDA